MEPTFSLLFSLRCLLTKIGPLSHSPLGWRYHPRSAKWSPRGFSVDYGEQTKVKAIKVLKLMNEYNKKFGMFWSGHFCFFFFFLSFFCFLVSITICFDIASSTRVLFYLIN
ncbi:hypothetical protein Hdeb2414_s0021g00570291 [Helianthus debilis subsp. tardiflorus]